MYCPACADRLEAPDSEGGGRCPGCGRTWYRNSAPTVGAALIEGDRALVTVRGRAPRRGCFDVPGGFLLPGEEPLTGLKREVREELGVEIEVTNGNFVQAVPHTYGDQGDFVLSLGFVARIVSGDPRPNDDVAGIEWVTDRDLDDLDFAWPHDRDLIRAAFARQGGSS